MSLLGGLRSLLGLAVKSTPEGAYHDGPYRILTTSSPGWLPHEWGSWNHWQMNQDPRSGAGINAMVEACVSAYAQTVAMCPLVHWERNWDDGGREQVTTSALSRIAIAPNDYQTRSDLLLNLVRSLYLDGNAYALALRNNRFEISSLHGMDPRLCRAEVIDGEIFYELGGNPVIDGRIESLGLDRASLRFVPARDVLHIKLNSVIDVLHGETPLCAAALAMAATNAALQQSISFSANQSRPSGILSTDLTLTKPKVDELRQLWNEHSKGLNAGGVPILSSGLKFQPMAISNKDTQAAELLKANDAMIAQVFRVPMAIVGSEQQPMGSTEALMNFWIAGGLGFALDRVELAFDKLFGLPASEYSELDSSVLLRSNLKDKIEAFARGTIGGIYSPNEARAEFELPSAKAGDEPRVQQQVVPLSFAAEPPAPPTPPASSQPSAAPGAAEEDQQADVAALVRHNARLGRIDAMLSH
jgi:HK97 family phage portal protein